MRCNLARGGIVGRGWSRFYPLGQTPGDLRLLHRSFAASPIKAHPQHGVCGYIDQLCTSGCDAHHLFGRRCCPHLLVLAAFWTPSRRKPWAVIGLFGCLKEQLTTYPCASLRPFRVGTPLSHPAKLVNTIWETDTTRSRPHVFSLVLQLHHCCVNYPRWSGPRGWQ